MNIYQARIKESELKKELIGQSRNINGICHEVIDVQAVPLQNDIYTIAVHLSAIPENVTSMLIEEFFTKELC